MTWVKLDDGFFRNRKARMAGKDGRALFLAGLCHCSAALTDGHIGEFDLPVIAAEAEVKPTPTAATLVKVGLWSKVEDGWIIHDYNHYNRPAETVRRERDDGRERAARSRERRRNQDGTFGDSPTDKSSSSSSPLGVSSVSSSSSTNCALSEDDDWPTIIAKRRLAKREADIGRVGKPRSWLTKTAGDVTDEHHAEAELYQQKHPEATPLELADHLEPLPGSRPPERDRSCPECRGSWLVLDDQGDAVPCQCRTAS